jgi:aspartyl-tRNA(Asn)/glutamyl-tRNA(Gln) amidotransferase subunit A
MDENLGFVGARALAAAIKAKKLSPVEATQAVLQQVERNEPRLNAMVAVDAEGALAAARQMEAQVMRGEDLGPLTGVIATVKDMMAVKGLPLERGSRVQAGQIAQVDCPIAERLRGAGAILLGKTTTSEFGWSAVSKSPASGLTHNPWRHNHNAGASSAGAAVAAAAGYGPLHQGSDGAGSVRLPAHFCGVVGLKPSYGRIPYLPVPNNDSASHIGPITRTVDDCALMFEIMSGPYFADVTTLDGRADCRPETLKRGVKGLKIAYSPDLGHARVDPEIAVLVARAAETFEALGAKVEQVTPPWGPDGPDLERDFWPAIMAPYAVHLPKWEKEMDPGLVACIKKASGMSIHDFWAMRARKLAYVEAIHRWFEGYDLLLTPSASVAAFPLDRLTPPDWPDTEWDWLMWAEFSYPFNLAHNPAISVPCGFTTDGLPVGLQIVGKRLDDTGVLVAAAAFEEAQPFHQRPPGLL